MRPLKPLMLVRPPLGILSDPGFWEELEDACIDEVIIQWLALLDEPGAGGAGATTYPQAEDTHPRALAAVGGSPVERTPVASYVPNLPLYEGLRYQPPPMPHRLADDAARLREAVEAASRRGLRVYVMDDKGYFLRGSFGTGGQAPPVACLSDPELAGYAVTRTRDTLANYPSLAGIVLDGPDFKWEIAPGHRDDMFVEECGCRHCERVAGSLGITYARVIEGRDRFGDGLRSLSPAAVKDAVRNRVGLFGAFDWWAENPAVLDWMRFKYAAVEQHVKAIYDGIKEYLPELDVGVSARMPALAPLTGHSLRRTRGYSDFQLPKLYWWPGGVAGFRGTVMNWVATLREWNPGLSEVDATAWLSAALGVPMPGDYPVSTYGSEAPDEWFATTVEDQVRKMAAAAGSVDALVPWVGLEHFGSTWITPSELRRLLSVMRSHGLNRYAYFVYNSIRPPIWDVIREFARDAAGS